jgi:predicted hydrocarbon binding protein
MEENKSNYIEKAVAGGMFKFHEDGTVELGNIAANIIPVTSRVVEYYLLSKHFDEYKVNSILYFSLKIQARTAVKYIQEMLGVKSKRKVIEMLFEQYKMVGFGKSEIIRWDEETKRVTIKRVNCPYAKHFKKLFGVQKKPICHYQRGSPAGFLQELFGEEMVVIEKECVAQNKSYCIEEAFPRRILDEMELSESEMEQVPPRDEDIPEFDEIKNVLKFV